MPRDISNLFFRSETGNYIFIRLKHNNLFNGCVYQNNQWIKDINWNIDGVCLNGPYHCFDPLTKEAFPRNLEVASNLPIFNKNPYESERS